MTAEYQTFIEDVRFRAYLHSANAAVQAVHATLETLAERIDRSCAARLASHLPSELRVYLLNTMDRSESFALQTFFQRICLRENGSLLSAMFHAHCVIQVLAETVSLADISEIRSALPSEYRPLFEPLGRAFDAGYFAFSMRG